VDDQAIASNQVENISIAEKVKILLTEYEAIEKMHAHYDVLNMSMTAIITAGVFTVWGIVIQSAFQSHPPTSQLLFVNSVSILALLLFMVLSVWIRYTTIHRCIVIKKLNRSHEIEETLGMKQNLIFHYDPQKFEMPFTSDDAVRRPGGHTLELLLYLSLSTFGGMIALLFQWHLKSSWTEKSYVLISLLIIAPVFAVLWMTFCKLDAMISIKGKATIGFPWNILFAIIKPITKFSRWLVNLKKGEI